MSNHITLPKILPVTCHTHHVGPGSTFVAIKGTKVDGTDYIEQALAQGATHIVVDKQALLTAPVRKALNSANAQLVTVDNCRAALAQLSAQAWHYPAKQLRIIGVTGTKGKTSTVWLLEHILKSAGYKTALLSTAQNRILEQQFKTELTTQHPDYLHAFFALCVNAGINFVVMEVAAQALSLHRTQTIQFDGVIFTNFSQEHAEFYESMDDYFVAKCLIFNQVKPNAPLVLNNDNSWCQQLSTTYGAAHTLGVTNPGTYQLSLANNHAVTFTLADNKERIEFACPALVGSFNSYNCAQACAMALQLGLDPTAIAGALESFKGVPGRLDQLVLANGARAFIDYAHNPSSYYELLSLLSTMTDHLIVVFGAGGERDRAKRPVMGGLVAKFAQLAVLTSDNPRSEDPAVIAQEIMAGIDERVRSRVMIELDREMAIRTAYSQATPTSIIAILGKGTDEYQMIGTVKYPFSERTILKSLT